VVEIVRQEKKEAEGQALLCQPLHLHLEVVILLSRRDNRLVIV